MTELQDWNPGFPTWKRLNLAHRSQGMDKYGLDLLEVRHYCGCCCCCFSFLFAFLLFLFLGSVGWPLEVRFATASFGRVLEAFHRYRPF